MAATSCASPAAGMPGMAGHVATVHSFSKAYCMSGWRLGSVAAPAPLVPKMRAINESNVYVAPMVSQRAGLHALAPVSYTHLDVYKRQLPTTAECGGEPPPGTARYSRQE